MRSPMYFTASTVGYPSGCVSAERSTVSALAMPASNEPKATVAAVNFQKCNMFPPFLIERSPSQPVRLLRKRIGKPPPQFVPLLSAQPVLGDHPGQECAIDPPRQIVARRDRG